MRITLLLVLGHLGLDTAADELRNLAVEANSPDEAARLESKIGDLYSRAGRNREAARSFVAAAETRGASQELKAKATYKLAMSYYRQGYTKLAYDYMRRTARRHPNTTFGMKANDTVTGWDYAAQYLEQQGGQ